MQQGGSWKSTSATGQPLISIIIATYNAGAELEACLHSVIAQRCKDVEVIIVDGGSADNTLRLLQQYDNQIGCWISEPDEGIYDAMNKGTRLAKGRWLYFMGADDRLLPGFSDMASRLKDPDTLYYGNTEANGFIFKGEFSKYRLAKYCINHQAVFYPAVVFKKHQYDLQYKVYADYALNIQCWGDDSLRKQYVDVTVAWYNVHGFSGVTADDWFKQQKPMLIKKSMGWLMYLRFLYKRRKEQRRPGSNFY